jgi:hypothetical protein
MPIKIYGNFDLAGVLGIKRLLQGNKKAGNIPGFLFLN